MHRSPSAGGLLLALLLAACGREPAALTVSPRTVLLPGVGESRTLTPALVDDQGEAVDGELAFASADPEVVVVDEAGLLTARGVGTSFVTVTHGGLSARVMVVVAQPAEGVQLVERAQVVRGPYAVNEDPQALTYGVVLSGVELGVGASLLATDDTPLAGRVVSAERTDEGLEVVLELTSVEDLFNALEVHEELDLSDPGLLQVDEGILRMYDVQESDGRLTFTPKEGVSRQALGGAMGTTAIQPWGCESGVSFPWSQGAAPTFSVESNLNFTVDYSRQGGLRYLGATGTVKSSVVVKPTITAAVEGKVTCGFVLGRIPLTFLGPLSFFFGGSLPLGVGFELGGKLTYTSFGFEASLTNDATIKLGYGCTAGVCGALEPAVTSTTTTEAKLNLPDPDRQARAEVSLFAYGFAQLSFGPVFSPSLQFTPAELKVGVRQSVDLSSEAVQAEDPGYASSYVLDAYGEVGSTAQLSALTNLLSIDLAAYKVTVSSTISRSPTLGRGGHRVPAVVPPGEALVGTLSLDSLQYLGVDNVEAVEIKRRGRDGALVPVQRVPVAPGQSEVTWRWTPGADEVGTQTFYAYVDTTLAGPFLLELEANSARRVSVGVQQHPIAFLANVGGHAELHLVDPGTLEVRPLLQLPERLGPVQWSADHTRIFTQAVDPAVGSWVVWSVDPADGSSVRITPEGAQGAYWAVSPDGARISYTSGVGDLVVSPTDLSAAPRVVAHRESGFIDSPERSVWSPDSTRVAFGFREFDGTWGVAVVPADGSAPPVRVADGEYYASVYWPEPDRVMSFAGGSIYSVRPDGTDRQVLVGGFESTVAWAPLPDGQGLVFARGNEDTELWRTFADPSVAPERVTNDGSVKGILAPSPDGRFVAYNAQRYVDGAWHYTIDVAELATGTSTTVVEGYAPSW